VALFSTIAFYAAFVATFSIVAFRSTTPSMFFSVATFSSSSSLVVVVVAATSNLSLALASLVFLLFSTTSSFFLWILYLFILFFSTAISSSPIDLECTDVVAIDAFSIACSSSFFRASSQALYSSMTLPRAFPCLLAMTSLYVLAPQWTSTSSHVAKVYSHGTLYLLQCSLTTFFGSFLLNCSSLKWYDNNVSTSS
jgi:hypothetical protein